MFGFALKKWNAARAIRKERKILRDLALLRRSFDKHMLNDVGLLDGDTGNLPKPNFVHRY